MHACDGVVRSTANSGAATDLGGAARGGLMARRTGASTRARSRRQTAPMRRSWHLQRSSASDGAAFMGIDRAHNQKVEASCNCVVEVNWLTAAHHARVVETSRCLLLFELIWNARVSSYGHKRPRGGRYFIYRPPRTEN
jgi:hypothetical protein